MNAYRRGVSGSLVQHPEMIEWSASEAIYRWNGSGAQTAEPWWAHPMQPMGRPCGARGVAVFDPEGRAIQFVLPKPKPVTLRVQ
ncbi:hypothetical protein FA13DRAFT_935009 [Coprinellus micaceus]|uniref:Uncharacterized protein n=1 Tax=Coprinellus micaceus TaxID=71717 RepID=A0A4Y7SZX9_COPMI|nr:hypothetical protein FA13DRAFT_935009 [Coprinellus micaceus]